MDPALIDTITELVLRELQGNQPAGPPAPPKQGKKVLLCPGPGAGSSAIWQGLAQLSDIGWQAVAWPGFDTHRLERALGRKVPTSDPPTCWEQLVQGVEAVVLPSLDLGGLASLALLLTDRPPAGAGVAGIVLGKPVLALNEGLERYRRHSARLPGGFLDVFERHYRGAESMGVTFLGVGELAGALAGPGAKKVTATSTGRDVVTLEDLEAVRRRGQTVLEVSAGAIVTPLASQAAREMGIEVKTR
ncbi:MAG: hypothetical protein AB7S38_21610 [Vulcanimicrobiota bacterium]